MSDSLLSIRLNRIHGLEASTPLLSCGVKLSPAPLVPGLFVCGAGQGGFNTLLRSGVMNGRLELSQYRSH